jgi:antitoxin VapB
MSETTVFQSGNSQAVRLPKEFRFKTKTVEIFRRGDEVVLREKPRTMGDLLSEALAGLPPPTAQDRADLDAMQAAIKEPLPPDTRSWDALQDAHAKPTKQAAARPGAGRGKTTSKITEVPKPRKAKAR